MDDETLLSTSSSRTPSSFLTDVKNMGTFNNDQNKSSQNPVLWNKPQIKLSNAIKVDKKKFSSVKNLQLNDLAQQKFQNIQTETISMESLQNSTKRISDAKPFGNNSKNINNIIRNSKYDFVLFEQLNQLSSFGSHDVDLSASSVTNLSSNFDYSTEYFDDDNINRYLLSITQDVIDNIAGERYMLYRKSEIYPPDEYDLAGIESVEQIYNQQSANSLREGSFSLFRKINTLKDFKFSSEETSSIKMQLSELNEEHNVRKYNDIIVLSLNNLLSTQIDEVFTFIHFPFSLIRSLRNSRRMRQSKVSICLIKVTPVCNIRTKRCPNLRKISTFETRPYVAFNMFQFCDRCKCRKSYFRIANKSLRNLHHPLRVYRNEKLGCLKNLVVPIRNVSVERDEMGN